MTIMKPNTGPKSSTASVGSSRNAVIMLPMAAARISNRASFTTPANPDRVPSSGKNHHTARPGPAALAASICATLSGSIDGIGCPGQTIGRPKKAIPPTVAQAAAM